ncbi:MAG TPA: anthranilate phosphoribosyltransferase, partial [Gemmatimonadales bacterium]|nr:anthranilate phosphoribosyltransferase [Gemmatimonadales bacterium]
KTKGETADEVAGAAQALRSTMVRLPHVPRTTHHVPLVDTCGTGGGATTTFNISTTAAFVVAGAGIPVAKHGNRSFTSRSGSADVLEALGIPIDQTPAEAAETLAQTGLAFLFAPTYHPAMRHAAPVRKELKTTTIFNLLGPLANPAGVTRQVIGVHDVGRGPLVAEALARLGAEHALVVHAEVGMDEISPSGVTRIWEVRGPLTAHRSPLTEWTLDPGQYDLAHDDLDALKGGEPAENAERLERLLIDPHLDPEGTAAVLLNAAAAIYVSGAVETFAAAVEAAREALASGKAAGVLASLRGRRG